jgi:hypothetical protein
VNKFREAIGTSDAAARLNNERPDVPFATNHSEKIMEQRMNTLKMIALAACAVTVLAGPVLAQSASETPANKEYMAGMDKMHTKMMEATDADPTKSFAKKMIAHHEGAIDMSQTVLKFTKDEEIKKMANKMISEQQMEVKELKDWLAKH